jgi:hypothetical protein
MRVRAKGPISAAASLWPIPLEYTMMAWRHGDTAAWHVDARSAHLAARVHSDTRAASDHRSMQRELAVCHRLLVLRIPGHVIPTLRHPRPYPQTEAPKHHMYRAVDNPPWAYPPQSCQERR